MGITYVDGKGVVTSNELTPQIQSMIAGCEAFISIQNKGLITKYITIELSFARGQNKSFMIISDTTDSLTGLDVNLPLTMFRDEIGECAPDIARTLFSWRMAEIFGGPSSALASVNNADSVEIFSKMSEMQLLDANRHKKRFNYSVLLENTDCENLAGFYRAKFHISFVSAISDKILTIQSKRSRNNFHRVYNDLVRNVENIYRYIIKAPDDFVLQPEHFQVTKLEVDELLLRGSVSDYTSEEIVYTFDASPLEDKIEKRREVLFDIEIDTIVQKDQNEFTMIFGYPVKDIDVELRHQNTDIKEVDVVDIFTSRQYTNKKPMTASDGTPLGAKASVAGWVLPESAVVFIWKN